MSPRPVGRAAAWDFMGIPDSPSVEPFTVVFQGFTPAEGPGGRNPAG
ncbi:MAG: hypothetical protein OXC38_06925 [Gammaproteobacteria bacterium]|nr:hypothetical protein [Gammaproteobacteria bacterium]